MSLPPKFTNYKPLTAGRNAKVFKALNSFVGREVFLKIYPIPEKDSLSALREPHLLSRLEHSNLVKIFGADVLSDGNILLEMELVSGGSFQDVIDNATKTGKWPSIYESIRLVAEAASGLSHLHVNGYVHRDIKPANLVLRTTATSSQGLVTDLGLASKLNQSGRAFASQHSRLYRPPEVWKGAGYSCSSEVYQLGIVLFQLLGGTLDFSLSNLADSALKKRAVDCSLVDLESVFPHVDECLRRFLRNCICLEEQRISCIADFISGLSAAKVNHLDWRYVVRAGGFELERHGDLEAVYRVDVSIDGRMHKITRKKSRMGRPFRANGRPKIIDHRDIGRSREFRQFINWQ